MPLHTPWEKFTPCFTCTLMILRLLEVGCAHLSTPPTVWKNTCSGWRISMTRLVLRKKTSLGTTASVILTCQCALEWGQLRRFYDFLPKELKETIASPTGLTFAELGSWQRELVYVRNICAHYSRFYNRVTTVPRVPADHSQMKWLSNFPPEIRDRTFFKLFMIQQLHLGITGTVHRGLTEVVAQFIRQPFAGHDLHNPDFPFPIATAMGCPPHALGSRIWSGEAETL